MKDLASIFVQVVPIFLVIWLLGRHHGHQTRMLLHDGGAALAAKTG